MAPILPTNRKSANTPEKSSSSSSFRTTKADKRLIKHSSFVSRIQKSTPKSKPKSNSSSKQSRKSSNKLVTTLESLADALPEAGEGVETGNARINKQRSLKSRPGAMKKKARLEAAETERFRRNLVEMARGDGGGERKGPEVGAGERETGVEGGRPKGMQARWEALRSHIGATLEKKPA